MFRFTLKQCSYFTAVAEHGGIAQAARALNVSQPAVAFALDKLESALELTLLERHHARGVSLTPQGEEFLRLAYRLLGCAQEVDSAARGLSIQLSGALKIGFLDTLAPFYLPPLIKAFRNYHPKVALDVTEQSTRHLISGLRSGRFDAVVTYAQDMAGEDDVETDIAASVQPRVILPSDHPAAARKVVSLKALDKEPYVVLDLPGLQSYFEKLLEQAQIAPPVAFRSRSLELVRSAVGNGLGFSLVPMHPQPDVTYDGRILASRPVREQVSPLQIAVANRRDPPENELRRQFILFCRDFFPERAASA